MSEQKCQKCGYLCVAVKYEPGRYSGTEWQWLVITCLRCRFEWKIRPDDFKEDEKDHPNG